MARGRRMRRRRMGRGGFRRVRKIVKAVQGRLVQKKIYMKGIDISGTATTGLIKTFLLCDDDPDYDLVSDGTNIAECPPGSRVVKIDLQVTMFGSSALHEFAIYRDKDNGALYPTTAGAIGSQLWTADYSQVNSETKRNTLMYRAIRFGATQDTKSFKLFAKRKAMRRTMTLGDLDRIEIIFNASADDVGAVCDIIGRIWVQEP